MRWLLIKDRTSKLCLLYGVLILSLICFSSSVSAQTPIQCGQVVNGSVDAPNEEDRYTFNASAGDVVTLQITVTTANFIARMELHSPSNQLITSSTSLITQQSLTQSGTYTILIKRSSGTSQTGGYQVVWQRTKNPCNATQLEICQTTRASLRDPVELDAYTFNGIIGQAPVLRLAGTSLEFNPRMTLYDPDGISLASSTSTITRTLTKTGVYTALVNSNPAGMTGTYAMSFGNIKIDLTTPNGGEVFLAGTPVTIKWLSDANIPNLVSHDIQLSTDGGATFPVVIASGLGGNVQSFIWNVPALTTNNGRIRVIAKDSAGATCSDTSDAGFNIAKLGTTEATTYKYDDLNGLTETIYANGNSITYTYDDVGNRLTEVVSSIPIFRTTSNPSSLTAPQRGSATTATTITSLNGFNSQVTLSCAGLPSGVTCSFSPNRVTAPTNGTINSALTVNVGSGTAVGTHGFQITGTAGGLTRAFDMILTVTAAPDFTVTSDPFSLSAMQGSVVSTTTTITSLNGFGNEVTLSCTGLPANVTCSFSPSSRVTPPPNGSVNVTLTVNVPSNAGITTLPDTFQVRGVGVSGVTLTRTFNMTLDVLPPGETLLLNETFSRGIPSAWTIIDEGEGSGNAATWTTANPGGRSIGSPFATPFAIVDSNEAGSGSIQDEQLITPTIRANGCSRVVLEFSNQFRWQSGEQNETADVDVSTDGGSMWTNVLRMQGAHDGYTAENTKSIDITSAIASNPANVKIRFHYYNASNEWWWAIDNVKVKCASPPTNVNPGDVLISEFRLRGANGANDEFIELYNNTDSIITVGTTDGSSGWALAGLNADGASATTKFIIPLGTRIPARGHYLAINNSISGYSLTSQASGDITYTTDIADNTGIALFRTANSANLTLANRLDAVGFSSQTNTLYKEGAGLPDLNPSSNLEQSFIRRIKVAGGAGTGLPIDDNNNATDFLYVDTAAMSTSAGQRLGAPGPQNLISPIQRNAQLRAVLFDPSQSPAAAANRRRYRCTDADVPTPCDPNTSPQGFLSIRRTYMNLTGQPVKHLRFRIVDISTTPEGINNNGTADLRALSRISSFTVTRFDGSQTVQGLTLEQPPNQPKGGGFNSSLLAPTITLDTPLSATPPNNKITVEFLLGIVLGGNFRLLVNVEVLP